jgi:hypothetical protein
VVVATGERRGGDAAERERRGARGGKRERGPGRERGGNEGEKNRKVYDSVVRHHRFVILSGGDAL